MYQLILTILILAVVHGQGSLVPTIPESALQEIFGSNFQFTKAQKSSIFRRNFESTEAPEPEGQACITQNDERGECVPYYLCNTNTNTIKTDGMDVLNIRSTSPCPCYMDDCCLPPNKRPPSNPITNPPPPGDKTREGCGWRNPNGVAFHITGDTQNEYTEFAEFPWIVAVLNSTGYMGGGSLIHRRVVLTAAHVANYKPLIVRAGEWDMRHTKEIYPYQERSIEHIEIHEHFNKRNLFYDIALLFLSMPVDLAPNVGIVCLPPAQERADDGTRCFATGWGQKKFNDTKNQAILKKVELPVVDRSTCQRQLQKTRLGRYFELHMSFMCAGGEPDKDVCTGDRGSPLVCPITLKEDRYVQNGIVAWGIGCGGSNIPAVYVDVGNLRDWIDDKVSGRGFEPMVYTY